jgi:hypothetical protein
MLPEGPEIEGGVGEIEGGEGENEGGEGENEGGEGENEGGEGENEGGEGENEGGEGRLLQPFGGEIFGQPTVSRPKGIGNMPFSQSSGVFAMIMAALLQVDGTVPCLH